MRLFDAFEGAGYHSSVCTTFEIDFAAYESVALARLRGNGCNNNILVADSRMLSHAMDNRQLPRLAGSKYSVVGIAPTGVFHPKLLLQIGYGQGRLLVASANMTSSGLAGNLEVVGQVVLSSPAGPEAGLLRAAFDYVLELLPQGMTAAREQLNWALRRAPWLQAATPSDVIVDEKGYVDTRLLTHNHSASIGSRFVESVGPTPIRRLTVISPYWDEALAALKGLNEALKPTEIALLLQPEVGLFPKGALDGAMPVQIFPIGPAAGVGKASRFVHAKVFIAQTDDADHVLYGSTNCTVAALGSDKFAGSNHEVALYRRLKPGQALELLGINAILTSEKPIAIETLPEFQEGESIPLDECQRRGSGHFELAGDILRWQKPGWLAGAQRELELLDTRGTVLPAELTPLEDDGLTATFVLNLSALPAFARLVNEDDERFSASVVASLDELRRCQMTEKAKKAQTPLDELDDPDTLEDLRLLDIFGELLKAEAGMAAPIPGINHSPAEEETNSFEGSRRLSYEDFLAHRVVPSEGGALRESSLSASLTDSLRVMLNRVLGIGVPPERRLVEQPEPNAKQIRALFNRGDQVDNPKSAVEFGGESGQNPTMLNVTVPSDRREKVRKRQEAFKQTQGMVVNWVDKLLKEQGQLAPKVGVSNQALLQLRTLLQAILLTGSSSQNLLAQQGIASRRSSALMPCRGENSWPLLAGRLLLEMFRVKSVASPPLFSYPSPDRKSETPSVDVAEFLYICQWVTQAAYSAIDSKGKPVEPLRGMTELRGDLYRAARDYLGDASQGQLRNQVWDGLDLRYAEHLGVNAQSVRAEHALTEKALAPATASQKSPATAWSAHT